MIYTLCNHYFHFEDEYVGQLGASHSTTAAIFKWIQGHYGYANIIMGIFIALWTMLFFRRASYNFFEILILLCFVMGIGMLIYSIFGVLQGLIHVELMQIAGMAGFVYTTWAVGQFFGKRGIKNYLKALAAYILGIITFTVAAVLIGVLIDSILKH